MSDQSRRTGRLFWIIAVVYWAALFCATHIPAPRLPPIPVTDKTAHLVSYGLLATLLYLALSRAGSARSSAEVAILVLTILLAYGAIDEWTQIPVGRSCELADWYADAAGASVAMVIVTLIARIRASRSGRPPV